MKKITIILSVILFVLTLFYIVQPEILGYFSVNETFAENETEEILIIPIENNTELIIPENGTNETFAENETEEILIIPIENNTELIIPENETLPEPPLEEHFNTLSTPSLLIERIYPTSNISVVKDKIFNVTINVSCSVADCGEVNVSLDPSYSTYNFTTCSASGVNGPSQANCNTNYTGTSLEGLVGVTNGVQNFTIPSSGTYKIETYGARGGCAGGGNGSIMSGEFSLNSGDVLQILVGQIGSCISYGGGGGGTFVARGSSYSTATPLIVSGGGGGTSSSSSIGIGAVATINGTDGRGSTGSGGTNGYGGAAGSSTYRGSGGGGFYGNATGTSSYSTGGKAFISGGTGGASTNNGAGGFGGGGGNGWYGGGGGGGYSGGGGGATDGYAGGGGGSLNNGSNQNNTANCSSGNGFVVITFLGSAKGGLVSTDPTATPFYTNSTNPINISLNNGQSRVITWYVNATGSYNNYTFLVFANTTSNMSISATSTSWNTEITTYPYINITTPTTENGSYSQDWISFNITTNTNRIRSIIMHLHNRTGLFSSKTGQSSVIFNNFTSLPDDIYYINATLIDIDGNTNYTTTYRILIDNTFPQIRFISPTPSNSTIQSSNHVTVNLSAYDSNNHTVFLDWNKSLVLWMRMNNETGENSTWIRDFSTYGNNGTINGPVFSNEGVFGKALVFDSQDDYINIPTSQSLNLTSNITLEAWVKSGSEGYIIAKDPIVNYSCLDYYNAGNTSDGIFDIYANGNLFSGYCRQKDVDGFGGGWTLFATTDSTRCTESLPFGNNNLTNSTGIYATNRVGNMSHAQMLLVLYDNNVLNFSVKMNFSSAKQLSKRFNDFVSTGESVLWTANYSSVIFSGNTSSYRFSDGAGLTMATFFTRTTFSADDGVWGVSSNGTLNGNNGNGLGVYLSTAGNTPKFGQQNADSSDSTTCGTYYFNTSSRASSNIRMNIYIRESETSSSKPDLPFALSTINGGEFLVISNNSNYNLTSPININDNQWHHFAATYNGSEMRLYLDGLLVASVVNFSGNLPTNNNSMFIGRHYNSLVSTNYFNGTIDEIRIHNRVLSSEEINASFNANLYSYSNIFSGLVDDSIYRYTAYAQDVIGHINQTEELLVTYDAEAAATVIISSPEDVQYNSSSIDLKVIANQEIYNWWYNLDSLENISFTPNITIVSISSGNHSINVFANNTYGNIGSASVNFSIASISSNSITEGSSSSSIVDIPILQNKSDKKEKIECTKNNDCIKNETCYDNKCVKVFDIKMIDLLPKIGKDGYLEFTYFLKGMANINNDVTVRFWLEKDGLEISSGQDVIYLNSFEEKTETSKIFIPNNLAAGVYKFYVQVGYEDYTAISYRTVFVDGVDQLQFSLEEANRETTKRDYSLSIILLVGSCAILFIASLFINNCFRARIAKKRLWNQELERIAPQKKAKRVENTNLTIGLLRAILKRKTREKEEDYFEKVKDESES